MSEEPINQAALSPLDRLRLEKGPENLRSEFGSLLYRDIHKALEHVNHENLHFCTLYHLKPAIDRHRLHSRLSPRNRKALELADGIARRSAQVGKLTRGSGLSAYPTLKWIFDTGCRDDGTDNRYDEILELTATILVRTYKDASILGDLANMIYSRNRQGLLIHHLVWAFFEARVPYSLVMLAERLCSEDPYDVRLTCKLLGFLPPLERISVEDAPGQYHNVLSWLEENFPFLYYTGEGFHMTGQPVPYKVAYIAKYLCKPVSVESGGPLQDYNPYERLLADQFKNLDVQTRILLANFSYFLYRRNLYQWNYWIRRPMSEQLAAARMVGGLT